VLPIRNNFEGVPMSISRRDWLKGASAATATAFVPMTGCEEGEPAPVCAEANDPLPSGLPTYVPPATSSPSDPFVHGVASGDPMSDRVILWTRVTPTSSGTVEVFYEMALDTAFTLRVAAGTTTTDESKDYTVKVDPAGLVAGRTYYYRFHALGWGSKIGRTKTLPGDGVKHLRFASMSCANFAFGYFNAYRRVAERSDLDAVLFLGDYIYEFENGGDYPLPQYQIRQWDPASETVTLDEYRGRYRQYRTDPDLAECHRQHPFISTWDDHETANEASSVGADNHDDSTEGSWADRKDRKAAARQAFFEYQPIRGTVADPMYRTFHYGDLAEITFLDTRIEGRVDQISAADIPTQDSPARTMISATQEAWLSQTLSNSDSRWKIIAQQVMVAPFSIDGFGHVPFFPDQWDGYPAARERLYQIFENDSGGNVVVLTGDIHGSFAQDIARTPYDPEAYDPASGRGSIAVEIVCPAVTSPGLKELFRDLAIGVNPHMKYAEWTSNGYTILDVRPGKVQADWYFVDTITKQSDVETLGGSYAVRDGRPNIVQMSRAESPKSDCDPAPMP
jgi:alkaline phosphatase D